MAVALYAPGCQVVFPLVEPVDVVPHVPAAEEATNENDLTLDSIAIDTTQAAITDGIPDGVVDMTVIDQDRDGPSLAVLRARNLTIRGLLRLDGSRPFVIIAETITIEQGSVIDAAALGTQPGPGGHATDDGELGQGGAGLRAGDAVPSGSDSGGGGGAFGTLGAASGAAVGDVCRGPKPGGGPGTSYGDDELLVLEGGGAGGRGSGGCEENVSVGGGGGGAIQLSARVSISNAGRITAGGGGGEGGRTRAIPAQCAINAGSGAGGGAGGAIYLDAPTIDNRGVLAANGGGGGGGAKEESTTDAAAGADGTADDIAAPGGPGQVPEGGNGGAGAALAPAIPGSEGVCVNATTKVNAGGGGGGSGRIVLRGNAVVRGMTSPEANIVTP